MRPRFGLVPIVVRLPVVAGMACVAVLGASRGAAVSSRAGRDPDQLVREGRRLYLTSCSTCHGVDGAGTRLGPDLRGVGAASADFYLTSGRMPLADPSAQPVRKPPAFSRSQIDALDAYIASLGPGPTIPTVRPRAGGLAAGGAIFRGSCAACHGFSGNGGALISGQTAPSLRRSTPTQVGEALRVGPGQMPVFGPDTLSDRQVDAVARYVRYLQHPDDPGGLSLGRVGPITEGLVALFVGLGALALVCAWIERRPRGAEEAGEH